MFNDINKCIGYCEQCLYMIPTNDLQKPFKCGLKLENKTLGDKMANKMTKNELRILQALPLELKIEKSKIRITEFVQYFGEENVYISFSGGKDSTALLHLIRSLYPNIKAVYCDTGLEYPEIKTFIKTFDNIEIIRPEASFRDVLRLKGYPIISKEQAHQIQYARYSKLLGDDETYERYVTGKRIDSKTGETYQYRPLSQLALKLLDSDFLISDECCQIMKKKPFKKYEHENNIYGFTGLLAEESALRERQYLQHTCNTYDGARPHSTPLAFWTEQDILKYLKDNNVPIASVYGDIIMEKGIYKTTKCSRTGCCYCLFGIQQEKEPNRIQQLALTHPKIYEYCMKPMKDGGLGLQELMEFCDLPYKPINNENN